MAMTSGFPKQYFFVRGLAREAGHWAPFLPVFHEKFPQSQAFCLDIPGAGKFFKATCPPDISSIVDKMRNEFRVHADNDSPKCLIAMSLGGMIGIEWLKKYPEDFGSAVFLNTSVGKVSPTHLRLKLAYAIAKMTRLRSRNIRQKERFILELISNNEEKRQQSLDNWERIQKQHPVSPANFFRQLAAAARFRAPRGKPEQPVLLLTSTEDRLVDTDCSLRLHHLWHWPLRAHPWAGHDLALDDPEWTVNQIHQWLTETF